MDDVSKIEAYINENTKLIWLETPTNPMMNIVDVAGAAAIAKKHGIMLGVDNTFASPALQNPIDLGADIVMHSVTKYLGGHSDVVMGALAMNDKNYMINWHSFRTHVEQLQVHKIAFLFLEALRRFI